MHRVQSSTFLHHSGRCWAEEQQAESGLKQGTTEWSPGEERAPGCCLQVLQGAWLDPVLDHGPGVQVGHCATHKGALGPDLEPTGAPTHIPTLWGASVQLRHRGLPALRAPCPSPSPLRTLC